MAAGDASSALGSWRSSVSETSSANEHQLHFDKDRSRYKKNVQAPKATIPRPTSSTFTIGYPSLDSTHQVKDLSLIPGKAVLSNLSTLRSGNRQRGYRRTDTGRSVDAAKSSLSSKKNVPTNFNWKQRLDLPARTRTVLSRILNSFNDSRDNVNNSITQNEKTSNRPKLIRVVPLGLLSSMKINAQNISSQIYKILLKRLNSTTSVAEVSDNSTALNKSKDNSSSVVDDDQFWSPIALTSSEKSKNESFEELSIIKNNSYKKLGGTRRYSIMTSFDNAYEPPYETYLVRTSGNNSVGISSLDARNKFKSNSSKASVTKSWLPILQPANGSSKLLNYNITAEPENGRYYDALNIRDTNDINYQSPHITTNSRKRVNEIKQNNTMHAGTKKSKLSEAYHDDIKLVNTFLASNMQDIRIPSNQYPNKALEKVRPAQYSGITPPSETKGWPGGTSGIESLDDLILYHTYTNAHKTKPNPTAWTPPVGPHKPTVTMHQQPNGGYVGVIKKPAVTIHNSHWDYESPSTPSPGSDKYPMRPSKPGIVVLENRPHTPKPPSNNHYPNHRPMYGAYEPEYSGPAHTPTTMYPVVLITPRPTPAHKPSRPVYHYPSSHAHVTTPYPSAESSAKPSKCPNIIVTTNGNLTTSGKEGCPDVNIMITSGVTNNNVVISGSSSTTEKPVKPLLDDTYGGSVTIKPPAVSNNPVKPVSDIFSSVTSVVSSMLSPLQYPIWYFMIAPVMVIMAGGIGIAALLYPWALGWRSGRRGRFEEKAVAYPQPKPRRRRSVCNADCFAEDIVHEAVTTFERNLNTLRFSKYNNDIFGAASTTEKMGMTRRRKRNYSLINYYWWWLKSDT